MMTFGKKLQWQRKKKGLSQEELGAQLHVSRQAISKWEQDASLPDAVIVVQIARLFEVSTDYLLMDDIDEEERPHPVMEEPTSSALCGNRAPMILSVIAIAFGGLGHFVIYVLSRMIKVPYLVKERASDGTYVYRGGGGITDYNYPAFIREYNLQALCAFFWFLILAGLAYILWQRRAAILSYLKKRFPFAE